MSDLGASEKSTSIPHLNRALCNVLEFLGQLPYKWIITAVKGSLLFNQFRLSGDWRVLALALIVSKSLVINDQSFQQQSWGESAMCPNRYDWGGVNWIQNEPEDKGNEKQDVPITHCQYFVHTSQVLLNSEWIKLGPFDLDWHSSFQPLNAAYHQ